MIAKQRSTVVLNRVLTGIPSVVTDNARGVNRAMEHLGELGHRTVAYVAGPEASWADGIRWRSIREAALGLEFRVQRYGPYEPTLRGGEAAAAAVAGARATAVIAYNDLMAIGLIRRLTQLGIRVPGNLSVIGFDNIFGAEFCTPALTTVAAPLAALGQYAVRTLLDEDPAALARAAQHPARLPAQLVVRDSTAPAPRRRRPPRA
jgi:LacI family transcriptional regulator